MQYPEGNFSGPMFEAVQRMDAAWRQAFFRAPEQARYIAIGHYAETAPFVGPASWQFVGMAPMVNIVASQALVFGVGLTIYIHEQFCEGVVEVKSLADLSEWLRIADSINKVRRRNAAERARWGPSLLERFMEPSFVWAPYVPRARAGSNLNLLLPSVTT